MRQIMDYMKVSVKADSSDLEMQLHPQSLGTLHVQVASKNGVVTANFITQNETVKAALESQMVQLKESFAEQGVKVEAIEVTVQTHPFEQNLEQGRGNQSDQESGAGVSRRRTRRINLNTAFVEDEPQTEKTGFRVAVVLPKDTNTEKPVFEPQSEEDTWMTARNKWLLAHPDSSEAKTGAHIGLTGKNIDITEN